MSMGFGLCCCDDPETIPSVFAISNSVPIQFYDIGDRVFVTGFIRHAPDGSGTPGTDLEDKDVDYVHVIDARENNNSTNAGISADVIRFADGLPVALNPTNRNSIINGESFEYRVVTDPVAPVTYCPYGTTDVDHFAALDSMLAAAEFDFQTFRRFDPGDSLYTGPDRLGDGLSFGDISDAGDNGFWYRLEADIRYLDGSDELDEMTQRKRTPERGSGQIMSVEVEPHTGLPFSSCPNQAFSVPALRVAGRAGMMLRYDGRYGLFRPIDDLIEWRQAGNGGTRFAVSDGAQFIAPTGNDTLRLDIEFSADGAVRVTPFVNGTQYGWALVSGGNPSLFPPIEWHDPIATGDPCPSRVLWYGLAQGSDETNPLELPSVFPFPRWYTAGQLTCTTSGGTGRDAGKWGGFDVEYDNIPDPLQILFNGRWTIRSGVAAAIRPTSWGMQWPLAFSVTSGSLPAGLTLGATGIEGTTTATGSGTVEITVEDDSGFSVATSYNWDIV